MTKQRCAWVTDDALYIAYHDEEWGSCDRIDDDRYLFEMLLLESAQAGLSWLTILKRRENYRKAFDAFDPEKIASYDEGKVTALMQDVGIIRNRRKIMSAIQNAQAFLKIQQTYGNFYQFLIGQVGATQQVNNWESEADVPAETAASKQLSKALKQHGFTFVGPVICYAYMQAIGLVNDHTLDCYKRRKGVDKEQ